MRVVHWNTHHGGGGTDGKTDTRRLARALAALTPDVVSLNELESGEQVGQILQVLGAAWVGHFVTRGGAVAGLTTRAQGNAVLTRLALTGRDQKALYADRSAAYVRIANQVSVYSTHVDNEQATTRNVQLTQSLCWHKDQPDPRIICGDFNCQASAIELAPWLVWYKDAWAEAKKIAGAAVAFNHTGATRHTRIDYVFYRGLTLTSCTVPDTSEGGVYPSDHHPVVAVFADPLK